MTNILLSFLSGYIIFFNFYAFKAFSLLLFTDGVTESTPCSSENRDKNMAACLNAINNTVFNTSAFWFGDAYAINCPMGMASGMQCANLKPDWRSIATRTFRNTSIVGNFDRYLELHYQSDGSKFT